MAGAPSSNAPSLPGVTGSNSSRAPFDRQSKVELQVLQAVTRRASGLYSGIQEPLDLVASRQGGGASAKTGCRAAR